MSDIAEVVEAPLSREALAERYRAICQDPRFENLPGKIEIDIWGRIFMSPANNQHGMLQARLITRLGALRGEVLAEASVLTNIGLLVADVAWLSTQTLLEGGLPTPFPRAPDLCIEIASPSNSRKELNEKVAAYLAAGATEAWIVFAMSKRIEHFGASGRIERTQWNVDLQGLFD